jgi:hypothetical protein
MIKPEIKGITDVVFDYTKIISAAAVIFFISGFMIWNFYLESFGFSEFNIVQTRFILTGASFCVVFLSLFVVLILLPLIGISLLVGKVKHKKIDSAPFKPYVFGVIAILYLGSLYLYPKTFFAYVPSYFGGGRPMTLSIIASEEEINFLEPFLGKSSPVQTQDQCLVYQNEGGAIFLLLNRIVEVKTSDIRGIVRVPTRQREGVDRFCSDVAYAWINNKPPQ